MEFFGRGERPLIFVAAVDENGDFVSGLLPRVSIRKPSAVEDTGVLQELFFAPGHYFLEYTGADENGLYLYEVSADGFEVGLGSFVVGEVAAPGANSLTVVAKYDDTGEPIEGVTIAVYDAQGNILAVRVSDGSGTVRFGLPDGTFSLRGFSDKAFFEPLSFEIYEDMSLDYIGLRVRVDPPADARLVRIYGFLKDINLSADRVYKVSLVFELAEAPDFVEKTLLTLFPVQAKVDRRNGFFYADIVKGVSVYVICDEAHLRRILKIPSDRDVISFRELYESAD